MRFTLGALADRVDQRLKAVERDDVVARIWRHDHTVWASEPVEITDRLGWLSIEPMLEQVGSLEAFAEQVGGDGITDVVLCGMGGSSLAPEVLARSAPTPALRLRVLDTTHPAAVASVKRELNPDTTLFLVASKSGSTVETLSQMELFWSLSPRGDRFAAITDPGSSLERTAIQRGFRAVFRNPPDIGGRYSALSLFGLVPAALLGWDLRRLLNDAIEMAALCRREAIEDNPAAMLGCAIGEAARAGRDKLTLLLPEPPVGFGDWVEQLVAESTGKSGTGALPVTGEPEGDPAVYGADRLFLAGGDPGALEAAGHPVIRLDPSGLGAEFFRWEFAVAVAGHVLGIHPFDQPNVAEAKQATTAILREDAVEEGFDDLAPLLDAIGPGDYIAICAFLDPTVASTREALARARVALRDRHRVATTVGFGPRYLHSTGQLHKGGPDSGIFVQVVDHERALDVEIPGASYSFGRLIDAQALGDLRSLKARGRRVARVTLEQLEGSTR